MRPLPFTTRLALGSASLVLVALALFAVASLAFFRYEQFEQVDLELNSTLGALKTAGGLPDSLPPFISVGRFGADGRLLAASPGFPEAAGRQALGRRQSRTIKRPSPGWRVQASSLGDGGVLVAAYDLYEVRDVMMDMIYACLVAVPVLVALAAVGAWRLSHRALGPLRTLTGAAERIAACRLDQRVPVPAPEDDVRRLSLAFNGMLARLEAGFEQAQRFAADASHELRTPLTIMHGEIARLLRVTDISPEVEQRLVSLQEEIGRLERITEHLLLLARFDAGQLGAEFHAALDFSALVAEACEDAELLAGGRDVRLHALPGPGARVRGDGLLLRRLVLNLLDNGTRYNVPGGELWCELAVAGGQVELRVRNTGATIAPGEREQLFRRFYRADAARGRGGHGLGLALSREIARSHGGDLVLAPDPAPGQTEFLLSLPSDGGDLKAGS